MTPEAAEPVVPLVFPCNRTSILLHYTFLRLTISNNPWVEALVDSRWKWAGTHILTPRRDGTLSTPWGNGMWSVVGSADGEWTLGFDFAANLHNVRFDRGFHTAMSTRVGDNEKVMLKRDE